MSNSGSAEVASFREGDRVRVIKTDSPYTGCRGTIVAHSGPAAGEQLPLGYYVAIDGENGITRPFLAQHLCAVKAHRVRHQSGVAERASG